MNASISLPVLPHRAPLRNVLAALVFPLALALAWPAMADPKAFIRTADDPRLDWAPCPDFFPDGCLMTVLQGNPEKPNADVLMRIPAGSDVAHHWHTSAERMVLIAGEFHADFDGHDPVVMKAGTYAYGPPRLPHSARCVEGDDCLLFIAFEEAVDAIATKDH